MEGDEYSEVRFWLEPGTAKAIKHLSGHIELLMPKDPGSIVTASFAKAQDVGVPIKGGALQRKAYLVGRYYLDRTASELAFPLQNDALQAAGVTRPIPGRNLVRRD
ncbi:MAG TPA: hypothetical protein VFG04_27325 [Planctomycetaceae bacterium]|nr:hypothetical protein [Planctomycetaceae bacterium]